MKKKILSIILTFAIVMVLPLSAFAASPLESFYNNAQENNKEIVSTLTFDTDLPLLSDKDGNNILKDVLGVLKIDLHSIGTNAGMDLKLKDASVLSAAVTMSEDGTLLASIPQLFDKVLKIMPDDIITLMKTTTGEEMTEAQQSEFMQYITTMQDAMKSKHDMVADKDPLKLTLEDIKTTVETGDKVFDEWQAAKTETVTVDNTAVSNEAHDDAVVTYTLVLDNNDIVTLMDSEMVKTQMDSVMEMALSMEETVEMPSDSAFSGLVASDEDNEEEGENENSDEDTDEDAVPTTEEILALTKTMFAEKAIDIIVTINFLCDAEDNIVAANINYDITGDAAKMAEITGEELDEENNFAMDMGITYNRLSAESDTTHTVAFNLAVPTEEFNAGMSLKVTLSNEDVKDGYYNALFLTEFPGDTNIKLESDMLWNDNTAHGLATASVIMPDGTQSAAFDTNITVEESKLNADVSISLNVMDEALPIGKIMLSAEAKDDTGFFAPLADTTDENTLKVLTLDEDEMTALGEGLMEKVQSITIILMQNLPESAMNYMMNQE